MIMSLTDRIKVIRPESRSIFPYSNSVLIEDDTVTVIDAGAGANAYAEIIPERVLRLLLTHIHFDHIHGAYLFTNAGITVAPEEAKAYRDIKVYQDLLGFYLWDRLREDRGMIP
jgi:glyoxylase-like metal-dependent hydrolase (beta-lactamase superfamily II)